MIYALGWAYVPSSMFSRISVVTLYLRIFSNSKIRFFCRGIIVFLICYCAAFLISDSLQCIPFQRIFDDSIPGKCSNVELWWKMSNPPNIVADVAILILPIEKIWNLKVSPTQKLSICFICLTGSM